jgi:hypothetical protein
MRARTFPLADFAGTLGGVLGGGAVVEGTDAGAVGVDDWLPPTWVATMTPAAAAGIAQDLGVWKTPGVP